MHLSYSKLKKIGRYSMNKSLNPSNPEKVYCNERNPAENKKFKGMFVVKNDRGLHTRPATEIVKCATGFKADVFLTYQKNRINAKSLLGILILAASRGAKIQIEAEGEDAEEAVLSLITLATNKFNIKY